MGEIIRSTRSVCPVCLKNLPAALCREGDGRVFLEKTCPDHGAYRTLVWQGAAEFESWLLGEPPMAAGEGERCPTDCGLCANHGAGSCCVLLEVTRRCNLRCRFCFADGGSAETDPTAEELEAAIADIVKKCGPVLLQLSGGEPTLRDDLPRLVRFARDAGCSCVQLNTNGLRLAREPDYAARLAEAGLDIVFLQFDGTDDAIYQMLRGAPLLKEKTEAIRVCDRLRLGVTLVPTVVPGVNDHALGEIVRFACRHVPAVRGVHFQPVSYFGRHDAAPAMRYTLDRLMADLTQQAGIPADAFLPSRCDHPLCGFHASFLREDDGSLRPLARFQHASRARGRAQDNRAYVAKHWRRAPDEPQPDLSSEMVFDTFLYRLRQQSLTLSAMAFQDAMNLNIERLRQCTLHVYRDGAVLPFCSNYLTPMKAKGDLD